MADTLAEGFDAGARRTPSRPAVVEEGVVLSYGDLLRWSEVVSRALEAAAPPHRVALVLPNSAGFVAAFFAAARIGAVIAPLNAEYRGQELEYYLADIAPTAVVVGPETAERVRAALERLDATPAVFLLGRPPACERLAATGGAPGASPVPDAGGLLLYTSGSTGRPKRVLRGDALLGREAAALRALFALTAADRVLGVTAFSHVNGLVRSLLTAMLAGARLYPMARFARRDVLDVIARERVTFFGGVPHMFLALALVSPTEPADLSSLRLLFSSSAPLTGADNRRFHARHGRFVPQLYGSTETGTICFNEGVTEASLESVGRPLPGVRVRVLDDAATANAGGEGEIAVASPFAAAGYDGNPEATAAAFRDGWYVSGDIGRLDAAGTLTLTGRTSLMINRGGYKVNPSEVERVLREHPKVMDVAVAGVAGSHGDDAIRCVVVAREPCTAEELVAFCRARVAPWKVPGRIEFRDALPRSASGKVLRGRL